MAHIGIKLADGSFYPVIDEGSTVRKAMVVTTVKDKQPSVRINLYKSDDPTGQAGLLHVGSLMIEDLPSLPKGGPDVQLELGLDEEGRLNVIAREKNSGSEQSLTVALDNLPPADIEELPDFELTENTELEEPPITLVTDELPGESDATFDMDSVSDFEDLSDFSLDDELPTLESSQSEPADEAASPELDDFSMDDDFSMPDMSDDDSSLSFEEELQSEESLNPTLDDELPSFDETPDQDSLVDDFPSLDDESEFAVSAADGLDTTPYNSAAESLTTDGLDDDFSLNDFSMGDMDEEQPDEMPGQDDFDSTISDDEEYSMDDFSLGEADDEKPAPEVASEGGSLAARAAKVAESRSLRQESNQQTVRKTIVREIAVDEDEQEEPARRRMPLWARILTSVLLVALLLAIAFLVFRCVNDRTPPIPTSSVAVLDKPLVTAPEPPPAVAAPAQQQPAQPAATPAPATPPAPAATPAPAPTAVAPAASSSTPPSSAGREPGVWYKVRWGDTLWDLSIAYYRTPWQYMKIFRANPTIIKHPDKIIATTWIYIPK